MTTTTYPDFRHHRGDLIVTLTHIGEGYDGDYEPRNPADAPLYRVDLERFGVAYETDGGSACTMIRAGQPGVDYPDLVRRIADYAYDRSVDGDSLRRVAAGVSWFTDTEQVDPVGRIAA